MMEDGIHPISRIIKEEIFTCYNNNLFMPEKQLSGKKVEPESSMHEFLFVKYI